jgi:hypothetical protein
MAPSVKTTRRWESGNTCVARKCHQRVRANPSWADKRNIPRPPEELLFAAPLPGVMLSAAGNFASW